MIPKLLFQFLCVFVIGLAACSTTKTLPEFSTRHKNIYAEVLGTGGLIGVHYDMRLKRGRMDGPGLKAGFGGGTLAFRSTTDDLNARLGIVFFPIEFNYLRGSYRGAMVVGAGLQPMYAGITGNLGNQTIFAEGFTLAGGYAKLGWRFQPVKSAGFMGEIHWNPHFIRGAGFIPLHVGIGLGIGFK